MRGRAGVDRGTVDKVKCRGEVTGDGRTPWSDVLFTQLAGPETGLDEADERCMVEDLRVHPSTRAPRGDDKHRYARAEAVGPRWKLGISRVYLIAKVYGG